MASASAVMHRAAGIVAVAICDVICGAYDWAAVAVPDIVQHACPSTTDKRPRGSKTIRRCISCCLRPIQQMEAWAALGGMPYYLCACTG